MSHAHCTSPSHRGMPGVVSNPNGTCCAGHCHALNDNPEDEKTKKKKALFKARNLPEPGACAGGGTAVRPLKGLSDKASRIENHDRGGWRGTSLEGCAAETHWLPSGDLLCPRWCITYQVRDVDTCVDVHTYVGCAGPL